MALVQYCLHLVSIVLFIHCSVVSCQSTSNEDGELVLLHVLYRHGDRSQATTYPTDPVKASDWPQGFGRLTPTGMRQHYELGQYLRQRYIKGHPYRLLSEDYVADEVLVTSTNVDRTLMSAYVDLAGMFPPNGSQIWNPDIHWQPIPVHTQPWEMDHVLNVEAPCPKYTYEYNRTLYSEPATTFEHQYQEFFKFLAEVSGLVPTNFANVWKIADAIFCQRQHNYTLPAWVNNTVYDTLRQVANIGFQLQFNQPVLKRLRGGMLLKEIIGNIKRNSMKPKCHIYSAHDDTVTALTSAMNVFNNIAPPYATAVLVELILRQQQYFVKILYRNDSQHEPYLLTVPGCEPQCPLSKFESLLEDNIPVNWESECEMTGSSQSSNKRALFVLIPIFIILICIAIVIVVCIVRHRARRQRMRLAHTSDI